MCFKLKRTYNVYMTFTASDLKSTLAFFVRSISVTGVSNLKSLYYKTSYLYSDFHYTYFTKYKNTGCIIIYYLRILYYVKSNISKLCHAYNIHEYYKNLTTKSDYKMYN